MKHYTLFKSAILLTIAVVMFGCRGNSENNSNSAQGTEQYDDANGNTGNSDQATSPGSNTTQTGNDASGSSMPGSDTISTSNTNRTRTPGATSTGTGSDASQKGTPPTGGNNGDNGAQ